jgi:hypothetical protein
LTLDFSRIDAPRGSKGGTIMWPASSSAQGSTRVLLVILVIGVWGLLLRPYLPVGPAFAQSSAAARSATYGTLTVQRINVVDPDGKMRLIIAARLPGGVEHGKIYPRSITDAAGVLLLDVNGNEMGGVASARLDKNDVASFTVDCTYQLTDCIRLWKEESTDGKRLRTSFDIFDRRPYTGRFESSQGVQRVTLANDDQNAQLVISDPQGRARIRIAVDRTGKPSIVMLSPDGKEVYRALK